ncbi:hypothetical protein Cfla_3319 [Cellulomonas flavigena DSM 20109]|uniref:PKD domain-containing protein n=1 Tax=Cellulomonas flavigena (strain ATCC 482 / DSM 20109 / BCRC 11376 / JCM 18109 / NBRC 3775 / NCIMB 8073 / NRS 134) TaxID=446466 RepID=D5UC39_CELFN|nr:hypothetical protein [Cellulomonas flavigena]ADG76198.1 hypothetical protein Cfla_3319 [Cellulomonas flavigena DSM 20109]
MSGVLGAFVLAAALLAAPVGDDLGTAGTAGKGQFELFAAREAERAAAAARRVPPELQLAQYERAPLCREAAGLWTRGSVDGSCPELANRAGALRECEEGDEIVLPMWRQVRATPADAWGPWQQIDSGGCGVDLLPELTEADFRRLPLPAPTLTLQPDRGWVLVNIETIVRTDPTPITLRTDLLGIGITVEATPTLWTYDFGDGHTLTTRSPGHPYPDHDTFHEYEKPDPARTITLTAQWTGRYQVDGSPVWRDVDGVALTTTTSAPFRVEERTSRLVDRLCTDRPKPPDC